MTGANDGLGYETMLGLLERGAKVVMACRSESRANEAIAKARRVTGEGEVEILELDLMDFISIRDFVDKVKEKFPKFDCFICNAGVASRQKIKTKEGLEINTGTNHIGHFYLINLLMENIKSNNSRVVIVSSKLHERGVIDFDNFCKLVEEEGRKKNDTYSNSKLMNFYFAKELYQKGVDCHVLCPGLCYTNLFRDFKPRFYHYILFSPIILFFMRSAKQGAQNILHCALDNVNDDEKNPSKSFIVMNLKQTRSKLTLSEEDSQRVWKESEKICEI